MRLGFVSSAKYVAARDFRFGVGEGSIMFKQGDPVEVGVLSLRNLYRRRYIDPAPAKVEETPAPAPLQDAPAQQKPGKKRIKGKIGVNSLNKDDDNGR